MKKAFFLFAVLFVLSCGSKENQQVSRLDETNVKKKSRYNRLLSKFKEKSFDTLMVYSSSELTGEYKGIELDSADAVLFPETIAQEHFNDPPGLFAVYKFPIDTNRTGLIVRSPSMYVPSSIKLFLYDKTKDSITSYLELAETWGDAGDYMSKDAWLYKDGEKGIKCFIWMLEGHDNSVDNEKGTTVEERNHFYLLDISKPDLDTINKNQDELKKKFRHLITIPTR